MLTKHVIGYFPSLLIPALTSFGAIYFYTRLLTPEEYGNYALAINTMMLFCMVFFYWLQTAIPRLMPQALQKNQDKEFYATSYIIFVLTALSLVSGVYIFTHIVTLHNFNVIAWLAVGLALTRSLVSLNLAFHRSKLHVGRYNFIECSQAILGLSIGLLFVWYYEVHNFGAVFGMLLGSSLVICADVRNYLYVRFKNFDRQSFKEILHFGLPLALNYGLAFVIASSDRFFIEYFYGSGDVGIYSAGYGLVDRITTTVFTMVAIPSFPITIRKLEEEGIKSARAQTYNTGVAVLMLALPACIGLILTTTHLVPIFIGKEFQEGVIRIIPLIAISSLLYGLSMHYFDHAFYLAKKAHMLLFTQGPAALVNIILNLMLIPSYGYMGAVYATMVSYALLLILSICVGRRVFPVHFPIKPALHIISSVLVMAAALLVIHFPYTTLGLAMMTITGGFVYGMAILFFNVMNIRLRLLKILRTLKIVNFRDLLFI
jgi:O-antigen/teichoic acid export membrane protein